MVPINSLMLATALYYSIRKKTPVYNDTKHPFVTI